MFSLIKLAMVVVSPPSGKTVSQVRRLEIYRIGALFQAWSWRSCEAGILTTVCTVSRPVLGLTTESLLWESWARAYKFIFGCLSVFFGFVLSAFLERLHWCWAGPAVPADERWGRRARVLGLLHREFEAILGYRRCCLKNKQVSLSLIWTVCSLPLLHNNLINVKFIKT